MSTKSREVIWGGRIMCAQMRAQETAQKAAKEADRAERKLGRSAWWAGAAITNDRTMPQRRTRLARGRVQSLQDPGEPTTERHPPAAGYADLEA